MNKVDFYKLSRSVQDSVLASFRSEFAPRPLLVQRGPRPAVAMWVGVSGGAAVLLYLLYVAGYGRVQSALSLQPIWVLVIYAALAAVIAVGIFNAVAARKQRRELPFAPGIFLFPANVIDAREHILRVYPLQEASAVASRGNEVTVSVGHRRFSFPVEDAAKATEAVQAVEAARERVSMPVGETELRRLDPLAPPSVASPLATETVLTRTPPTWERQRVLIGAAAGALVGVGLFFLRNATSDSAMLRWARGRDDVASYRAYLERGRAHRAEVSSVHLPRAALREAMAKNTVDSIDAFTKEFPETGIKSEIEAARQAALVQEFERARATGSFVALLSFGEKYPEHHLGQSFDNARAWLYARARERYKKEQTEHVTDFVRRLVQYSEKAGAKRVDGGFRGPKVEVRFRKLPSKEIDGADELVRKNPMFNGKVSLPSQYMEPARMQAHERATAEALAARFGRAFDPEIATFEPGAPLEPEGPEIPNVTVPTLAVSYRVESSGAAYASRQPRGIFLGLVFFMSADFVLPGDAQPHKSKFTFAQRLPVDMIRNGAGGPLGTLEPLVYDKMSQEAFNEFREKYLIRWFGDKEKGAGAEPKPEPKP